MLSSHCDGSGLEPFLAEDHGGLLRSLEAKKRMSPSDTRIDIYSTDSVSTVDPLSGGSCVIRVVWENGSCCHLLGISILLFFCDIAFFLSDNLNGCLQKSSFRQSFQEKVPAKTSFKGSAPPLKEVFN